MFLEINEARQELVTIALDFATVLTASQQQALCMAVEALKVIDDGNYELKSQYE